MLKFTLSQISRTSIDQMTPLVKQTRPRTNEQQFFGRFIVKRSVKRLQKPKTTYNFTHVLSFQKNHNIQSQNSETMPPIYASLQNTVLFLEFPPCPHAGTTGQKNDGPNPKFGGISSRYLWGWSWKFNDGNVISFKPSITFSLDGFDVVHDIVKKLAWL